MADTPEQLLDRRPLQHLNELYPAVSYMEITDKRDGSKSIVGTRQTIRKQPLYVELPKDRDEVEIAAGINQRLQKLVTKANTLASGAIVVGFTQSLPGSALNRQERREREIHEPRRQARRKAK